MYAPINQIQSLDDEDEERDEVVQGSSFLSNYNPDFGEAEDFATKSPNQKCADFACFNGAVSAASIPFKISCERLIQEGFDLASPQMKAKKRKAEADDGGGRVVRATGRKDRHSKVRTARGPRDRRVRLSPTTAIQFYDVQDRLGYDRPSKAIDWLINEAKTAIDALEDHPRVKFAHSNAVEDHGSLSQHQDLNGFSCFVGEMAPPPPAAVYLNQDYQLGFCSASNSSPQILETNCEVGRLQRMFTWNSVNESSGGGGEFSSCNSLAPPLSANTNLFREPLQSSIINYTWMNNDFAGINFSNELSKIAASASPKQDENFKKLIFSMPSAQYQD